MVTLHEVITFLVSMQISISSLQTHNVNRCGRSRHLARKLSLRRKRSSPNVFEMAATETKPIAVRYTQDAFSRSGWLWPVDAKGEPLKATSYMAVGFYVAKYVNKKSDMDL